MKYFKSIIFLSIILASTTVMANKVIFESAKNHLNLDSKYIEIEYDFNLVKDFCPKQSVGCYISADMGRIFVENDLTKTYHDVVIFGLYSDYLQHSNIGLIDSSLTCDLQVNYLIEEKQNDLADLFSNHCNDIKRNKFLAFN